MCWTADAASSDRYPIADLKHGKSEELAGRSMYALYRDLTVRPARPRNEDNVLVLRTVSLPYFRSVMDLMVRICELRSDVELNFNLHRV